MNWLARLSRGFGYLTLDPSPRLRRLREESRLDAANVKYAYYCRECQGTLFRVAWYIAPRAPDGSPRPPGWAIECSGCGRVTLIPEAPDMAEAGSARPGNREG